MCCCWSSCALPAGVTENTPPGEQLSSPLPLLLVFHDLPACSGHPLGGTPAPSSWPGRPLTKGQPFGADLRWSSHYKRHSPAIGEDKQTKLSLPQILLLHQGTLRTYDNINVSPELLRLSKVTGFFFRIIHQNLKSSKELLCVFRVPQNHLDLDSLAPSRFFQVVFDPTLWFPLVSSD